MVLFINPAIIMAIQDLLILQVVRYPVIIPTQELLYQNLRAISLIQRSLITLVHIVTGLREGCMTAMLIWSAVLLRVIMVMRLVVSSNAVDIFLIVR